MNSRNALIEVRTGSESDIPKIKPLYEFFTSLGIPYTPRILSAHRTPQFMAQEAKKLSQQGFLVSIAAAGGSAHLPGMTASETIIPVVGLPIPTFHLGGRDSLYSIIQMPNGIPVGTVGIGQSEIAGIVATQIAYRNNPEIRKKIRAYRGLPEKVLLPITDEPMVGIIKPSGIEVDEIQYSTMITLMEKFGLKRKEYKICIDEDKGIVMLTKDLELSGTIAIIVLNVFQKGKDGLSFSGYISKHTEIPIIGLPIVSEVQRINLFLCDEIFKSMLCYDGPKGETKGYPVAGMGINRYTNAAIYAAQIAGIFFSEVQENVSVYRMKLEEAVKEKDARIQIDGIEGFF